MQDELESLETIAGRRELGNLTLAAVLSLGVGIGVISAIFSCLERVGPKMTTSFAPNVATNLVVPLAVLATCALACSPARICLPGASEPPQQMSGRRVSGSLA
jgi:hypothetical protein